MVYLKKLIILFMVWCFWTGGVALGATNPRQAWKIIESERFTVYFPPEKEAWTRKMLADLELHAAKLERIVGFKPKNKVDLMVSDGISMPNGFAVPGEHKNRIVLYTTPPQADSILGSYPNWAGLVALHEYAHVLHLSRPDRDRWVKKVDRAFYVFDVGQLIAPRWITEGYATYLEGKVTGRGRPHSDLVASILRQFAINGSLPDYSEINEMSQRGWFGGGMAYVVGAAFFLWLEQDFGEDKPAKLWVRMTGQSPSFFIDPTSMPLEDSFQAVYGVDLQKTYERFLAEMYWTGLETEKIFTNSKKAKLWQRFEGRPARPTVSKDGKKVAMVQVKEDSIPFLNVYNLDDNELGYKEWQESEDKRFKKDPEDIKAVRPDFVGRDAEKTLYMPDGGFMMDPVWFGQDKKILFVKLTDDSQGFFYTDLYTWDLDSDRVNRITTQGKYRRPTVDQHGKKIVAVHSEHGYSSLVEIDEASGDAKIIMEKSLDVVYDQPVFHPSENTIAYLQHKQGDWTLELMNLDTKEQKTLLTEKNGSFLSDINWGESGEYLYFSKGHLGFVNGYRLQIKTNQLEAITWQSQPVVTPQKIPGGSSILYKTVDLTGYSFWIAEADPVEQTPIPLHASWHTTSLPEKPKTMATSQRIDESEAESSLFGPQKLSLFYGADLQPKATSYDLGVKGGDLVGRWDWQINTTFSEMEVDSGSLAVIGWKRFFLHPKIGYFEQRKNPENDDDLLEALPEEWHETAKGWFGGLTYKVNKRAFQFSLGLYQAQTDVEKKSDALQNESFQRKWDLAQGGLSLYRYFSDWRFDVEAKGRYIQAKNNDEDFEMLYGAYRAEFGKMTWALFGEWHQGKVMSDNLSPDMALRIGGNATSSKNNVTNPLEIYDPSLVDAALSGYFYQQRNLGLTAFGRSVDFFYRAHRVGFLDGQYGDWLPITGLELRSVLPMMPLPEIRGLAMDIGLARVKARVMHTEHRYWVNIRYQW